MNSIVSSLRGRVFRKFGRCFPKRFLVKYYHKRKLGRKIDLKNPERFSDKLGWYKLYYRDEIMRTCTDKASVRDYIDAQGFGYLLNECYGVYDSFEEINWNNLPKQFVLKNTLGGSGKSVILIHNKDTMNIEEIKEKLRGWIKHSTNWTSPAGEWVYEDRKARIIIEKLLVDSELGDLPDYKFFCFNGKAYCLYYMRNCTAKADRHEGEIAILDRDFNLMPVTRPDFLRITEQPPKPKNYEQMLKIAEKLSEPFPHVRVDFYNIDGKIVFGELTFFTNCGVVRYDPDSFDFELGRQFELPKRNY